MAASDQESSARQGTHAKFQPTLWTKVIGPAGSSSPEGREALNELCRIYWFPLYAFIRGQGIDSHKAKDLTQDFFIHLLENHLVKQADREKGHFRSFLLSSL